MIIKTKNSTYRVTPLHTNFEVEKIAESVHYTNGVDIGWKRTCKEISIAVGGPALFGDFGKTRDTLTSTVTEVYNESPLT